MSIETKVYILSYNHVSKAIVHYAKKEQAELQGVQYQEIEASGLKEAKEIMRDYYIDNHTEGGE